MQAKGRPTIVDVARVAKVHFTTVSLALRDHASIPPGTRDRIRQAAAEIGYTRNPVFAALAHYHVHGRQRPGSPRLAYLSNHAADSAEATSPYHLALLGGARRQALALGYEVEVFHIGSGHHDSTSLERELQRHQVGGLIFAAFAPDLPAVTLDWSRYAAVKINSTHLAPAVSGVSNNQLADVRLAFRRLTELGYRRVGLAINQTDELATHHRHAAGWLIEQSTIAAEQRVAPLIFPFGTTAPQATRLLRQWILAHHIDAVLCHWERIDELVTDAGFTVPAEVACACLCLLPKHSPHHARGGLSGIAPNLEVVGEKAVSILATALKSGERGEPEFASETYVNSHWQDGPSAPRRH